MSMRSFFRLDPKQKSCAILGQNILSATLVYQANDKNK